jgi:Zn-dependent protease with chaperone function
LADLPKGMEITRENIRAVWRRKVWLFLPFLAAIVVMGALLFLLVQSSETQFTPASQAVASLGKASLWLFLSVPYLIFLLAAFIGQVIYRPVLSRNRFALYVGTSVRDLRDPEAMKFEDALGAVSIAAGVESPKLVFLVDDKRSNAMAFVDDKGVATVGVTTGMLKADLPVDEATAVMAHELAHLRLGVNVDPPHLFQAEYLPNLLLVIFFFMPIGLFFLHMTGGQVAVFAIAYTVVLGGLIALRFSSYYNVRMADRLYFNGDMLADAVAVKLIRDPDALRRAIKRVNALNKGQGYDIRQVYFAKYQFLPPSTTIGDYYRYAGNIFGYALGSDKFYVEKMAMFEEVDMEKKFFLQRMANLHFMTQGKMRSIADWAKGD